MGLAPECLTLLTQPVDALPGEQLACERAGQGAILLGPRAAGHRGRGAWPHLQVSGDVERPL